MREDVGNNRRQDDAMVLRLYEAGAISDGELMAWAWSLVEKR